MFLTVAKTCAYGLWKAAGTRPDGGRVEAMSPTKGGAERLAQRRAATWERCDGCARVTLRPGEAAVSRRAFHGQAFCPDCQRAAVGTGPDPDHEREAAYGL